MKRPVLIALATLAAGLALAAPAAAADGAAANQYWFGGMAMLGAAIAIGLAAALCGLAQGRAAASACEATARNPGSGKQIFLVVIIGMALIESLVIYSLVIAFNILGKVGDLGK